MPLKMRKTVLLAKAEVTYGVDSTPTGAANAVLVRNFSIAPLETEYASRDLVRPYFGNSEQIPLGLRTSVEFEVELQSSGTAGTAPAYAPLLKACYMAATNVPATSETYKPTSTEVSGDSVVMYVNIDGVLHKLLGARGTVVIDLKANAIPVLRFRFLGLYGGVTDTVLPTPTYTAFKVPVAATKVNTPTASLHGTAIVLSALEIDLGNAVEYRGLVGAESIQITDRQARGSMTFEAQAVATKNWWTTISAATLGNLSIIHGLSAGNIIELAATGTVQVTNPRLSDEQGIAMLQVDINLIPTTAGNDEFSLIAR